MNLEALALEFLDEDILKDGTWEKVDFYNLSTENALWNHAAYLTLAKKEAKTCEAALIYLLQKETKVLGLWQDEWANATPTVADFIKLFAAEKGFSNVEGAVIPTEDFWKSYRNTIEGISCESDFVFSKNDVIEPFTVLLDKEDIVQVTCFDDEWNEQNFLVETTSHWVLYHWASAT
jgi:hypothetical protein